MNKGEFYSILFHQRESQGSSALQAPCPLVRQRNKEGEIENLNTRTDMFGGEGGGVGGGWGEEATLLYCCMSLDGLKRKAN